MLAPNAMQQRNRGLGQITSPKPVSNFAGRYHTNNVPYGSTTMTNERSNSGALDYFLSIGNQNTGLSFHQHSEAWNGLIWGRKRWFLVPDTNETDILEQKVENY